MQYLPKLEDYMKALELNQVFSCEDEHFIGFKYNAPCVYFKHWNDTTLNARGIVFDKETGEIVARPFYKFFNYHELINGEGQRTEILDMMTACGFVFDRSQSFRVMDKLDGSLGIMFWDKYADTFRIKTGGSFASDQAVWAQQWIDEHFDKEVLAVMPHDLTYCFEIIYNADVHPIHYDFEGVVLLGIVQNKTGFEEPLDYVTATARMLGVRSAEVVEFKTFDEVIPYATALPNTKEGVVVTFENGFKCKIKGKEFLDLQRTFHNLTPQYVYDNFDWTNPNQPYTDAFKETVPEELKELRQYMWELKEKFLENRLYVAQIVRDAIKMHMDRKAMYQFVVGNVDDAHKKLVCVIMQAITAWEKQEYYLPETEKRLSKNIYLVMKP